MSDSSMDEAAKKRRAVHQKPSGHAGRSRRNDWLGRQLRELYDEYGSSPLPDDLRSLVDRLGRGDDDASGGKPK
jgi:Anti-sigma factor NepR